MMHITIYTKDYCPYCVRAKQLLEREQLSYQEIDIGKQPDQRAAMIAASNGRTTVPQIFIDEQHIGGCDDLFAYYRQHGAIVPVD